MICVFYRSFQIGESPVASCLFHNGYFKLVSVEQLDVTDDIIQMVRRCVVTVGTGSGGGPGNPDWGKGAAVVG